MSNARNLANLLGTKTKVKDVDVDGTELILDADGDTSITADTDDQIDIKIGGSDVGVIGSNSSRLHIVNGDTGLRIAGDIDQVFPCGTSGADRDNAIDLGSSGVRFKDLYLSGGLYVGGTGSANYLDDYEEGTFTPVVADDTSGGNTASNDVELGNYIKIGNLVFFSIVLANINTSGMTSSNAVYIRSLPFTALTRTSFSQHFVVRGDRLNVTSDCYGLVALTVSGGTHLQINQNRDNVADDFLSVAGIGSSDADIFITGCYVSD